MKVTVYPDRLARPGRSRNSSLQERPGWADIESVSQNSCCVFCIAGMSGNRQAAELVHQTAGRVDRLQSSDKPCQAACGLVHIGDRSSSRHLARQPAAHSPRPREPLTRLSTPERNRGRERQMRGQDWKPPMLIANVRGANGTTRQPHHQIRPQAEDRVVPASRLHRFHVEASPLPGTAPQASDRPTRHLSAHRSRRSPSTIDHRDTSGMLALQVRGRTGRALERACPHVPQRATYRGDSRAVTFNCQAGAGLRTGSIWPGQSSAQSIRGRSPPGPRSRAARQVLAPAGWLCVPAAPDIPWGPG